MTHAVALTAVATVALLLSAVELRAADNSTIQKIRPLQGISIDLGKRRGVGYFLNDNGKCRLVVTVADEPNLQDGQTFTATRFEAEVPAGQATRYDASEAVLEFACEAAAQSMEMTMTRQYASEARR